MSEAQAFKEVPHRGLITVATMLAMIMQVLDMTIANIALPSMQASLGAAQDTISWVLTSYIVASAIATPLTGWVAERIGRRRLFLICVVGFVSASALCGLAQSLEQMVFFRILQGAFGASMAPLSQAVLLDVNPRERHGQAMAMWGAGIMVAPVIGPTLGGWLTEVLDWRWVFYINVPVGAVALIGMWLYLPETPIRKRSFDFFGFAALSLGIGALQLLLDRGQQLDWFQSPEVWLQAGLSVIGVWVFIVHSATAKEPFLEVALFRDRNFAAGLFFMFMIATILLSTMALLPPMLEHLYGYPTVTAGLLLGPRGLGTMLAMVLVGRLVRFVDPRLLVLGGLGLTAYALYDMTGFSPEMGSWPFVYSGVIQGVGMGLVFVPLNTLAFATLATRLRTEGASMFNLARNIGSAIGVSIMTTLLARAVQTSHAEIGSTVTPFINVPANGVFTTGTLTAGNPQVAAMVDGLINQQAQFIGYLNDFKIMTFITLACAPLLLLIRKPAASAGPAPAMGE